MKQKINKLTRNLIMLILLPLSCIFFILSDVEYVESCVSVYNSYWQIGNLYFYSFGLILLTLFLRWLYCEVKEHE